MRDPGVASRASVGEVAPLAPGWSGVRAAADIVVRGLPRALRTRRAMA